MKARNEAGTTSWPPKSDCFRRFPGGTARSDYNVLIFLRGERGWLRVFEAGKVCVKLILLLGRDFVQYQRQG